jgi:hypothetical protein
VERDLVVFRRFSKVSRTNRAGLFPDWRAAAANWAFKPFGNWSVNVLMGTIYPSCHRVTSLVRGRLES